MAEAWRTCVVVVSEFVAPIKVVVTGGRVIVYAAVIVPGVKVALPPEPALANAKLPVVAPIFPIVNVGLLHVRFTPVAETAFVEVA